MSNKQSNMIECVIHGAQIDIDDLLKELRSRGGAGVAVQSYRPKPQTLDAEDARIGVFFPEDAQIIYGCHPVSNLTSTQKSKRAEHSDKPAEIKAQLVADAKIQIGNILRRLRVLNVDEEVLAPELLPRSDLGKLVSDITRKVSGPPAWTELYKHLAAALREAECLTPTSKLTDDDSGETD